MNEEPLYFTKEGFGVYVMDKNTRELLTEERKMVTMFIDTYGLSALQIGMFLYSDTTDEFLQVSQVCVNFKDKCIGVYLEKPQKSPCHKHTTHDAAKPKTVLSGRWSVKNVAHWVLLIVRSLRKPFE